MAGGLGLRRRILARTDVPDAGPVTPLASGRREGGSPPPLGLSQGARPAQRHSCARHTAGRGRSDKHGAFGNPEARERVPSKGRAQGRQAEVGARAPRGATCHGARRQEVTRGSEEGDQRPRSAGVGRPAPGWESGGGHCSRGTAGPDAADDKPRGRRGTAGPQQRSRTAAPRGAGRRLWSLRRWKGEGAPPRFQTLGCVTCTPLGTQRACVRVGGTGQAEARRAAAPPRALSCRLSLRPRG